MWRITGVPVAAGRLLGSPEKSVAVGGACGGGAGDVGVPNKVVAGQLHARIRIKMMPIKKRVGDVIFVCISCSNLCKHYALFY